MDDWMTITEVEKETGIPNRTLRRYITQHSLHLPAKKDHRNYLVRSDAVPTLIKIRDFYANGMSFNQVEEALIKSGQAMTVTIVDDGERVAVNVAEALTDMRKAMAEVIASMTEEQRRMSQEIKSLRFELTSTKDMLDRQEVERNEMVKLLPKPKDPLEERQERITELITIERVKSQLRNEALHQWSTKPESERMRKIGWLKKEEDRDKRDQFINDYVSQHLESKLNQECGLANKSV